MRTAVTSCVLTFAAAIAGCLLIIFLRAPEAFQSNELPPKRPEFPPVAVAPPNTTEQILLTIANTKFKKLTKPAKEHTSNGPLIWEWEEHMTQHVPYRVVLRVAKTFVQDFEANLQ
jgi:hypothetical protein